MTRLPAWLRHAAGYLFTNRVHVFFMPALVTFFWNFSMRLPLGPAYYLMITLTTAGGYITNMQTDRSEDALNYTARYRFFGVRPRLSTAAAATCFVLGFLLALRAGWAFVWYGGAANFLAGVYGWSVKLGGRSFRIKDVPVLKNLYAGFLWVVALVLTPCFYAGRWPGASAVLLVLLSLGADLFVEVMWDVRDVIGDRACGVRTIPVMLGERTAFWVLHGVHMANCLCIGIGLWLGLLAPWHNAIFVILYLPAGLLFLLRYRHIADKVWAASFFLVIAAGILAAGILTPVVVGRGA